MKQIKKLLTRKKQEGETESETQMVQAAGKNNKKKIENLAFFLVILIVTLIAINTILGKGKEEKQEEKSDLKVLAQKDMTQANASNDELEKKLEKILETMYGVRKSKCANYLYTI